MHGRLQEFNFLLELSFVPNITATYLSPHPSFYLKEMLYNVLSNLYCLFRSWSSWVYFNNIKGE
jgi:hypothetical protein